ncbi:Arabinose metabolism transcriptional repressor [compost metagenome]
MSEEFESWIVEQRDQGDLPTALVCANDFLAIKVVAVLAKHDIRVPEEVSVAGFDNIDDAFRSQPTLTTVNVPKEAMGKRAVKKLLERIQLPELAIEKMLVAAELVHRDSTSVPRA